MVTIGDWVIRMNPDVIIRDDTLMLDVIQNDPNATAILLNCISSNSTVDLLSTLTSLQ